MNRSQSMMLVWMLACHAAADGPAARPTPEQVAWHETEVGMFIHFAPNTYTDLEYDDLTLPLDKFNPAALDTEQWAAAAEAMGARYIILVAKHAGGFCLWQTDSTEYGVRNTPWRGGRGDVLRDLAESCRKRGLRLGVYLSPTDRYHGAGGGGRVHEPGSAEHAAARRPLTQPDYDALYRRQLRECLTIVHEVLGPAQGDGAVFEVWFDGSVIVPVGDILRELAPRAMVFQGPHATIRWVGNEDGVAPYPAWNAVSRAAAESGIATAADGTPDGDAWLPNECDARMRNTWFWNRNNAPTLKSVEHLMDMYYRSVGHGAVLLLNHTPDPSGVIPAADVQRGLEFREERARRFSQRLAQVEAVGARTVELPLRGRVAHVVIEEDIREGERVRAYTLEGRSGSTWRALGSGSAIGYKRIVRIEPVELDAVRLTITECVGEPRLRRVSVYAAP